MNHPSSEPVGPPPDPSEGHERTDIAAKPILYFLVGLVVFGGLVQLSMSALMMGYVAQDTKSPQPKENILRDTGVTGRLAPLQQNTTADMVRMQDEEDEVLTTFHRNPKTKELRVPLDIAMEIVARKGLPHREVTPKGMPTGDLIPRVGKSYKTTN